MYTYYGVNIREKIAKSINIESAVYPKTTAF